jgi:hypothetical protein
MLGCTAILLFVVVLVLVVLGSTAILSWLVPGTSMLMTAWWLWLLILLLLSTFSLSLVVVLRVTSLQVIIDSFSRLLWLGGRRLLLLLGLSFDWTLLFRVCVTLTVLVAYGLALDWTISTTWGPCCRSLVNGSLCRRLDCVVMCLVRSTESVLSLGEHAVRLGWSRVLLWLLQILVQANSVWSTKVLRISTSLISILLPGGLLKDRTWVVLASAEWLFGRFLGQLGEALMHSCSITRSTLVLKPRVLLVTNLTLLVLPLLDSWVDLLDKIIVPPIILAHSSHLVLSNLLVNLVIVHIVEWWVMRWESLQVQVEILTWDHCLSLHCGALLHGRLEWVAWSIHLTRGHDSMLLLQLVFKQFLRGESTAIFDCLIIHEIVLISDRICSVLVLALSSHAILSDGWLGVGIAIWLSQLSGILLVAWLESLVNLLSRAITCVGLLDL